MVGHFVEVGLGVVVQAPVDPQRDAGGVCRRWAQQVDDGPGDLRLGAMALQRDLALDVAQHVVGALGVAVEAGRGDEARDHRIHPHARMGPFDRGRQGDVGLARTRSTVMAHAGHAELEVGADIDDRENEKISPTKRIKIRTRMTSEWGISCNA